MSHGLAKNKRWALGLTGFLVPVILAYWVIELNLPSLKVSTYVALGLIVYPGYIVVAVQRILNTHFLVRSGHMEWYDLVVILISMGVNGWYFVFIGGLVQKAIRGRRWVMLVIPVMVYLCLLEAVYWLTNGLRFRGS